MTSFSVPFMAFIAPDPIPSWMWGLFVLIAVTGVVALWLWWKRAHAKESSKPTSLQHRYLASFWLTGLVGLLVAAPAVLVLAGAVLNHSQAYLLANELPEGQVLPCQTYSLCQVIVAEDGKFTGYGEKTNQDLSAWNNASQFGGWFVRLGDGTLGLYRAELSETNTKAFYLFISFKSLVLVWLSLWLGYFVTLALGYWFGWRWFFYRIGKDIQGTATHEIQSVRWPGSTETVSLLQVNPSELHSKVPGLFLPLNVLGASSIRVVPIQSVPAQGLSPQGASSLGGTDPYARLDPIVLAIAQKVDSLQVPDTRKLFRKNNLEGTFLPESILVRVVRGENGPLAVVWAAFEKKTAISAAMVALVNQFCEDLISGIVLPANGPAEVPSQELLSASLGSLAEPVFLAGPLGKLLFANKAAQPFLSTEWHQGKDVNLSDIVEQTPLKAIFKSSSNNPTSNEVWLPGHGSCLVQSCPVDLSLPGYTLWMVKDINPYREQERLRSEFLNAVSHDLRGPLARIRGYTGMMEMAGNLNDQQVIYAQKINDGIDDMTRLVNSLLDLGRIDAGIRLQVELTSVVELVENVAGPIKAAALQKNILFTKEINGGDAILQIDSVLMKQALTNVLENAVKYSDPGAKVWLKAFRQGSQYIFEIGDTGLGINSADQQHLFEKFYRGQQAQVKARKGSGLGLAIVKSIVEHHKGKIWFESVEGKGTVFTISLPVRQQ